MKTAISVVVICVLSMMTSASNQFALESMYRDFVLMEEANPSAKSSSSAASSFKISGAPDSTEMLELVFYLQESNSDQLEALLAEISDPTSARYGQYMTKDEVDALTANPDALVTTQAFLDSLQAGGVTYQKTSDSVITATGPVSTWEKALNTQFMQYSVADNANPSQQQTSGTTAAKTIVRTDKYSLPTAVAPYVSAIFNTVQFPVTVRSGPIISLQEEGGSVSGHHHHQHAQT
jgi:tripeptidyl-peptidase-1